MTDTAPTQMTPWMAYSGMTLGAAALLMALITFWAGPFAPQPTLETSLGESAAEIGKAAIKSFIGKEPPPPEVLPWDIDRILRVVVAVMGGLAVISAVFAFVRGEPRRPVIGAVGLGFAAIMFQFFAMLAIAILFVMLLSAVMDSLGLGWLVDWS